MENGINYNLKLVPSNFLKIALDAKINRDKHKRILFEKVCISVLF